MDSLGNIIRKLRNEIELPLRTVAAYLDIDQAILSRIERRQRKATREQVLKLAEYFQVKENNLLIAWLSDEVVYELADEPNALKALQVAEEKVKYIMRKTLFAILTALFSTFAFADNSRNAFSDANSLYQKGEFEKAAVIYEEILKSGDESPEIYFNLGNAYYKLNNLAKSILNYERAKRLAPDDEDIEFNLKLANLKVVDKIDALPVVFYKRFWNGCSEILSMNKWSGLTLIFCWIMVAAVILFMISRNMMLKKITFFSIPVFFMVSLFSYFFAKHQSNLMATNKNAVIFESNVYVKSSPDEKAVDLFILHEGTKVNILDEIGEWKKIRLANGNEGWMKKEGMEEI